MNYSEIFNVPKILAAHGVKHAVIAPGSRSAPLTIALARSEEIACKVIPDERSAAFIALGMSQQSHTPVVLLCTSGTAALNFAPAVAEAFYADTRLIVLTADRPPERIDQRDGQTIRQNNLYGSHVKGAYTTPTDLSNPAAVRHFQRILSEAMITANIHRAPVHINFPFREPLYPDGDTIEASPLKIITTTATVPQLTAKETSRLTTELGRYGRKLIVCGQGRYSQQTINLLSAASEELSIPVAGDIISNIHRVSGSVTHPDLFLTYDRSGLGDRLRPDLLITFGRAILSKSLKLMLREHKPAAHWHIEAGSRQVADTYESLTRLIPVTDEAFLSILSGAKATDRPASQQQENYCRMWQEQERKSKKFIDAFFPREPLGELELVKTVIDHLPPCHLHLANSMSVRYANLAGLTESHHVTVYANRGTSGIDGSNSTAVGHSLLSDRPNVLITGDLALFYDRNAFWHHYQIPNLRIVLLNNHGGSIFRMIAGPASVPELEDYFETRQKLNAQSLAAEFGFEYLRCPGRRSSLKTLIKQFMAPNGSPKLLELETQAADSKKVLDDLKEAWNAL